MARKLIYLVLALFFIANRASAAEVLTLDEFIKTAVENHPRYRISAQEYLIALQQNRSAKSIEDWNPIASGFWNEVTPPPVISGLTAQYQKSSGYSLEAKKYFANTGTEVKLGHLTTRMDSKYPPPFEIPGIGTFDFNPPPEYYLSSLSLTITQPLLKNAFGLASKNTLKISDYLLEIAKIKLAEDWEDFISMLREEYLAWQKCHTNTKLFENKVKTVKDQLALVEDQLKYGLSEELDVVQIKQKSQGYKIMLEQAKLACETQTRKIHLLMNKTGTPDLKIEPQKLAKSEAVMDETESISYLTSESNIKRTADIAISIQKTNWQTKENEKRIDLKLVLQTKPSAFAKDFGESISKIGAYNDTTISLTGSRPWFNQKAEAAAQQAKLEHQKAIQQKEDILLNAQIGLSFLYTSLKYLKRTLELNENNLKLARQRLSLEKRKFDQGRSSVFFLLQAEDDSLEAENNLNQTLFARENVINQIKSFTDRYLIEYKDVLKYEDNI